MYRTQFKTNKRFVSKDSHEKHPLFVNEPPLTIGEMLHRSVNGIPLSIPKPRTNDVLFENKFFTDKFDVLDTAIRLDIKKTEELKQKDLEERKKQIEERKEFLKWQEEQKRKVLEHQVDVPAQ